ncbi:MAG: TonB-dependent outer rane transport protein [Gemmatimonadetes bacterium]|nr:TonB-dependent outer rane transport protein [Gemmatimonadota bacterium]
MAAPVWAHAQDSVRVALPTVRVTGTREGPRAPLELPYAVTLHRPDSLAALRRTGVDELLFGVPGVALANRQNPAQDPRVSIRGFGARSAFGVRGVRVLQDGVPVTLPDGQTPVDALDLEGTDRVEVVRGSASSLYGNAAGGVIDLRSALASRLFTPYARIVAGANTPTVSAAGASGTVRDVGITSSLTRIVGRGYRDYSDQRVTRAAMRMVLAGSDGDGPAPLALSARISDVSRAESPGALTRAQFDANPQQYDPQSYLKGASKTVQQEDVSLVAARALGAGARIDASVFGGARVLNNPTTQAIIDVKRASGGASMKVSEHGALDGHDARISAGVDAQWLNDDRQEYTNCIGVTTCAGGVTVRGTQNKNQRELVGSVGPYARAELALLPTVLASAGVRSDAVNFRLRDRLITATNPDDSGERTLNAVSPSAGLVWRATPLWSVYGSVSSSFDTPTTTELGNKEDGSSGINPSLQPQRATNLEVGSKGFFVGTGVRWDIAVFEANVHDELVPFDIPNGNGRRFYRNAGRTVRRGGELGVDAESGPVALHAAYEYSHYRYVSYVVGTTSYAGRRIPGIPEQALMTSASLNALDMRFSATADLAGPADVDDANTAQAPGRAVFGLAVSREVSVGGARFSPLVALQNVGGVRYAGSLSVNATAGKFYEPAPGRTLLVRVTVGAMGR